MADTADTADTAERADVRAAVDGELRLLDPEVRASADRVLAFLDPEFTEIGASGQRWDAASILTVTGDRSVSEQSPVEVEEMAGTVVAPGVVQLTYRSYHEGRRVRRSSLWRLTDAGWRMYFHQGTPVG